MPPQAPVSPAATALASAHRPLGKKWVLQILLDMMLGRTRFSELSRANPGLSDRILAKRLQAWSRRA